eukprot:4190336-Karenia_brevis.AAC.1
MDCAMVQHRQGMFFAFEHPASATSWNAPSVIHAQSQAGVHSVTFDQCMLGLRSPSGRPLRKRTRVLTNSRALVAAFQPCKCDGSHEHLPIQGSEFGVKLSVRAQ